MKNGLRAVFCCLRLVLWVLSALSLQAVGQPHTRFARQIGGSGCPQRQGWVIGNLWLIGQRPLHGGVQHPQDAHTLIHHVVNQ
jgi:hypothetical protein